MELRRYIAIIIRWWWLVILLPVATAAITYAVSQRQTPVYTASATVIVGQSIQATDVSGSDILTSERLARTYAEIAGRQPVLQGTVETLGLNNSWYALKKRVKVKQLEGTQLLEITVEANSPEEARLTADEIARQLILLSPTALENEDRDENRRLIRQRVEDLQAKIEAGGKRVEELEAAMVGTVSAQQVQELQQEINTLQTLLADWEDTHTQLLIFIESKRSPNYLAVIEPAQASPVPVRPRVLMNTVLGGAVGFLLALGLIFLMEYLDDTLKTADDLSQSLGLNSLGSVSRVKGKYYREKLVSRQDAFSPVSEAYRQIRSNIQFMSVDRPIKSMLVSSSTPGEGKSFTVANLGITMAQADLKTIIVDTDLRRPVQHQVFTVPNTEGLTDLLRSPELEFESYLRDTTVENLQVLPCGTLPPNPAELLGSQRMARLMADLNEIADVVIYDSPPAVAVTDAAVLSSRVDGVVLVFEAGKTSRDVAKQAVKNLEQASVSLLGGVLNRVSQKRGGYYYHYSSDKRKAGVRLDHSGRRRIWRWLPFPR
jgi:non-specific protein-tyrosine kinase